MFVQRASTDPLCTCTYFFLCFSLYWSITFHYSESHRSLVKW